MMSKLFFITHPDVIIDSNIPIEKWDLSEKGENEALSLLMQPFWQTVDIIYTSEETKAVTVGEMASQKFMLQYIKKGCIGEIDRSSTGYLPYEEYMEAVKHFFEEPEKSYNGWETAQAATQRIVSCVDKIVSSHPNQNIAIIGHGGTAGLLICYMKGVVPNFKNVPADTTKVPAGLGFFIELDWKNRKINSEWVKY
ncbi:MAG: histidine phosphatase family protein [Candidatus Kerfeldbacteria bacterium]|nr:histidine phosphatase family protein [Candidatus Kerfeldbacteria bacterium]